MHVINFFAENIRRRRVFRLICLLLFILPVTVTVTNGEPADSQYRVYVGTYTGKGSEGIYAYRFDPTTGESSSVGLAASMDNPSFLAVAPKGRFLYAVNELDMYHNKPTGAVSVFAIDPESSKLKLLQQVSSLGSSPTHLSLDKSARYLMIANYNSGSVAVFSIRNDGQLGSYTTFVQDVGSSVNPERQAGPHAHSIQVTPDNRFVLVADLGIDKLLVYRFDSNSGALTPATPPFVKIEPGSGPRHFAFAPSGKFVYLLSEMGSTVTVYAYNPERGTLQNKQTVSTLPKNFTGNNRAAEIAVDEKGRFLYVSNRGDDSIVEFSINPKNGSLTPLHWVPSGGKTPRYFAIDPSGKWLFAANQDSNNIRLFQIDPKNGRLIQTAQSLNLVSPVCVRFVPLKSG